MLPYRYDKQELRDKLLSLVAANKPHKLYEHNVEYAKKMKAFYTGKDQEEYLLKYKLKEDSSQQKQKIRLTNTRTQYVCHKIDNSLSELNTVDPAVFNINYGEDSKKEGDVKDIKLRQKYFHEGKPLSDYAFKRIKDLNIVDPNAFIVIEKEDVSEQFKGYAFPLEIYSHEAWQYEKKNGILQYLIAKVYEDIKVVVANNEIILQSEYEKIQKEEEAIRNKKIQTKKVKEKTIQREIYTLYGPEVIYRLSRLYKGDQMDPKSEVIKISVDRKEQTFALRTYETNNPHNPAMQVGYLQDACSDAYVSILHGAEQLFLQLMWEVSELQLAKALHGFIQKFVYAPTCNHSRPLNCSCKKDSCQTCNGTRNITKEHCNGGHYSHTGEECSVCKGQGKITHITVQDIVVIRKPETKEQEVVPLSEMVHFVELPIHILEAQEKSVQQLERDIPKAVLNFDLGSKEESKINETATGRILDMRGLYGVLGLLGKAVSHFIKHATQVQAGYLGKSEGLVVEHNYPLDLRLDTVEDKIQQRKLAVDAGLPTELIQKIDESIMVLQCNSDYTALKSYKAWEKWKPLGSKTMSERMSILAMYEDDHYLKILDSFWDYIKDDIEDELDGKKPFSMLSHTDQKALIDKYVEIYKAKLSPVADNGNANPFNGNESEGLDIPIIEEQSAGGSRQGNALAQSVGGSSLVGAINKEVAEGAVTREGGINRAMIQLGYDRATAELLVPVPPTRVPNQDLV